MTGHVDPQQPDLRDLIDDQQRMLEACRTEIAALRTELAALRQEDAPDRDRSVAMSRRALFGLTGAGIAGLVVGDASPAAAADGDPVLLGAANSADQTTLIDSTEADPVLRVQTETLTALEAEGFIGLTAKGEWAGVEAFGTNYGVLTGAPENGFGVMSYTEAAGAIGVAGHTTDLIGVVGVATSGIGGAFSSQSGPQIVLSPNDGPPYRSGPPPDSNVVGALSVDNDANLWLCVFPGEDAAWTRLNYQTDMLDFPQRAYDSRTSGGRFGDGETRLVDLRKNTDLPSEARIAIVTLSVTATSAAGYASIYSSANPEFPLPGFASITWSGANQTQSTTLPVRVSQGTIRVYSHRASHLIFDVVGHHS